MGKQVMDTMLDHFSKSADIPEGFIQKFKETANPDSLVELLVPIYVKNLDEETLDGTIAFFESAAGKKFIKAQPFIMKESMEVGEKVGRRGGPEGPEGAREDDTLPSEGGESSAFPRGRRDGDSSAWALGTGYCGLVRAWA